MSLSLLVSGVIGAAQSIVLTAIIGPGAGTDAFLVAYSVYVPLALLGQSLRGSLVPIFGPTGHEAEFRDRATRACARALMLGLALAIMLLVTSPLLARLLTPGLSTGARRTAVVSLVLLAPAAFFQFYAATLSSLLAAARRFERSAVIYTVTSLLALVGSAALLPVLGPIGAACGLLIGTAVLAGWHTAYVRQYGVHFSLRIAWLTDSTQYRLSLFLISYAGLGLAQQINLSIALAGVSGKPGLITVYSFAYFLVAMLLNVTSVAVGFVLLPDLVGEVGRRGLSGAENYAYRVLFYTVPLVIPALASYLALGRPMLVPIARLILPAGSANELYDLGTLFCAIAVPTMVLQVGVAVAVAMRRWRLMLGISLASVGLQFAVVSELRGHTATAVAVAHILVWTGTSFAFTIGLFGRRTVRLLLRVTTVIVAPAVSALVFVAARLLIGRAPSFSEAAVAATAGGIAYVGLLVLLWPSARAPLHRGMRRLGRPQSHLDTPVARR